jgi:hypothetical protein
VLAKLHIVSTVFKKRFVTSESSFTTKEKVNFPTNAVLKVSRQSQTSHDQGFRKINVANSKTEKNTACLNKTNFSAIFEAQNLAKHFIFKFKIFPCS